MIMTDPVVARILQPSQSAIWGAEIVVIGGIFLAGKYLVGKHVAKTQN